MNPAPDKKILVTGGGGFLGKAIVKMLIARGDAVRTFSRSSYPELESLGAEHILGDLADAEAIARACKGIETVFHVAAKAGVWGTYDTFHQANVIGTLNVLNACQSCNVQRLIYTSTPSVIFNGHDMHNVDESVPYPKVHHHHYPKTKAMAEQEVRKATLNGLRSIILRPHIIWGPEDTNVVPGILARAHRLRQIGDGTNIVDTIYIDNAAQAHLQAERALIRNPDLSGNVYFISQDDPIPAWDMINAILEAAGKPRIQKTISPQVAMLVATLLEGIYSLFRLKGEPPLTRWSVREAATSHWFNITAAKEDLEYSPKVSTQEGLRLLEDWLQKNPYKF
jgi:nucleoside-diphosphate-sugar epimerase